MFEPRDGRVDLTALMRYLATEGSTKFTVSVDRVSQGPYLNSG